MTHDTLSLFPTAEAQFSWLNTQFLRGTTKAAWESRRDVTRSRWVSQLREELRQQKVNQETEAAKLTHRPGVTAKRRYLQQESHGLTVQEAYSVIKFIQNSDMASLFKKKTVDGKLLRVEKS